jgi:hypothetical protein
MRRLLAVIAALLLVPSLSAGAAPSAALVEDSKDIERVFHDTYGNLSLPGSGPFFASGTDLAFDGSFVYAAEQADTGDDVGGVHIYDVTDQDAPVKVGFVSCPGYQNDVAVVEPGIIALAYHRETGGECRSIWEPTAGPRTTAGVRLFDVSDPANPVALGVSEALPGGTHTLTVHPSGDYIYASPGGIANGGGVQQILDITDRNGPFPVSTFMPNATGCHDFEFFTSASDDTSMGVCVGLTESQIWDVTDPTSPVIVSRLVNPLIQFHHSAMVTSDGKTLVIGDEAIGANECLGGPTGAMYSWDISDPALPMPKGYFGINRSHDDAPVNSSTAGRPGSGRDTWCTAHIYNFIPGTSIMVAVWYSGGLNIIDWSDPAAPRELAHYRTTGEDLYSDVTNYWSGYWHDGRIYANDRVRGFDALKWTAFEEHVAAGGGTDAKSITALARSLPSTTRGWHAGRFSATPTVAQSLHIAQRGAVDLRTDLSPYACRLTLLDD